MELPISVTRTGRLHATNGARRGPGAPLDLRKSFEASRRGATKQIRKLEQRRKRLDREIRRLCEFAAVLDRH